MRSQKSRSRSKSHRNRSTGGGNVLNRVFDSSGPEGKVRGTPQQIIDKYNQLERDAQLGNDRVAAENFQQHAEHYTRMLSEAQREQDARREEQERQNRERQAERDRERTERQEREAAQRANDPVVASPEPEVAVDPGAGEQPETDDSGLVETPESTPRKKPARRPRTRKPAVKPDAKPEAEVAPAPTETPSEPSEAAE
ncbi:MAG: DUF4167 domain-containing protein [Rhodobacteraceae bacterium]|nr:DUF4167 domain-containing protein [Paracoccaceae bacterium]